MFPALSDLVPFGVLNSNDLNDLDKLNLEDLSLFVLFAFFTDLTDLAALDDLGPTDLLDFDLEDFGVLDPFALEVLLPVGFAVGLPVGHSTHLSMEQLLLSNINIISTEGFSLQLHNSIPNDDAA